MNCQKCNKDVKELHKIWMLCGNDMSQLGAFEPTKFVGIEFFTIQVCDDCRASWMEYIMNWYNAPILSDIAEGSGIFVRINMETREISEKEWNRMYPGTVPYRMKLVKEDDGD
jgi:hypothetical protein